jgi:hypothetical protein
MSTERTPNQNEDEALQEQGRWSRTGDQIEAPSPRLRHHQDTDPVQGDDAINRSGRVEDAQHPPVQG